MFNARVEVVELVDWDLSGTCGKVPSYKNGVAYRNKPSSYF